MIRFVHVLWLIVRNYSSANNTQCNVCAQVFAHAHPTYPQIYVHCVHRGEEHTVCCFVYVDDFLKTSIRTKNRRAHGRKYSNVHHKMPQAPD